MRYQGTVYRPPSEAGSLLIQATLGCPHNRCTFCAMYKKTRFRIRPVREIKEDIAHARLYYGDAVRTMFFPDGNSIFMKTDQLVEIFEYAYKVFPRLERITVYGSARFILRKSLEEWKRLKRAGLGRIHSGMETGDDVTLERIVKGTDSGGIIKAGHLIKEAGIELSEYYLAGIGGQERWREHAEKSAEVLNAINPDFIRVRTLVPMPGTLLYEELASGRYALPSPHGILRELRLFIESLEVTSRFYSDHVSNYLNLNGPLPGAKPSMLMAIDHALSLDERLFDRRIASL